MPAFLQIKKFQVLKNDPIQKYRGPIDLMT